MPFDLFISYARRDNAPLKNYDGGLDRAGPITQLVARVSRDFEQFAGRPLRPFFDTIEIHGMEDWRQRILLGLRESRLLLACLSPSYLASEYCEWEFIEYLNHEVAHGFVGEGVAPLYFVEVPGWQDKDFEQHCAQWVADLRRRNHFDVRPWFNEGEQALRHADVQARMEQLKEQIAARIQRGERAEQSLGNVDAPNPHFIGRATELRRLRETVALKKVGVLTAVHGLGGMGKTALAIEYAHAFSHEYGGGRWQVRCEGRDQLAAAIATLAPALSVEFSDAEKLDSELQCQRILAKLRALTNAGEPHNCLLLLDNVDQPKLLEPAQSQRLHAAEWLHVIATTRLGETDLFGRHQDRAFLPVDELPEADALDLIESFQPEGRFADDTERVAAAEIVHLLGRFTLAVEAAAVYLGQFAGDITCAGFLARLKKDGLEGLESAARETTEGLLHDEKSLTATLQPTLERLSQPERLALSFAAFLPADQIALPWIRALVAAGYSEFGRDSEPGHPDPWQNLLRRLFGLRLWQTSNITEASGQPLIARMHRLLQELLKTNVGELAAQLEQALLAHITERAKFFGKGWMQREHWWELAPLTASAWHWLDREGETGAWLANAVGWPLQNLGDFTESERLHRQSVEMTPSDNPNYGERLSTLAEVLSVTNRLAEAESLMRRSLAVDEQRFGPDHHLVAIRLNNLALLLKKTNRLAEAEPLFRRALASDERSYGRDHPVVTKDLNNLAMFLSATAGFTEAEALLHRALAFDQQCYGSDHPDVARDLNNLAMLLRDTNRLAEAEPLMHRVVEILEKTLGQNHMNLGTVVGNLAQLMVDTKRMSEAEPLMRRSLAIHEQYFGPEHPYVAMCLNSLARLLQDTNRAAEAEPLLRRVLVIDEHNYGPDHPDVASDLSNLAQLLRNMKRPAEAEPLLRRSLEIVEKKLDPNDPEVATVLNNLAQVLKATNRLPEAEPLMRRVLAVYEKSLGPDDPAVATALNNLAQLLQDTNRLPEAELLTRRAIAIDEQRYGLDDPQVAGFLNNLGMLLQEMNRLAEAELVLRRSVEIYLKFRSTSGHRHPHLSGSINNYANLLTRKGLNREQMFAHLNELGREFDISFGDP